jgi:hypothetical protein
MDEKLRSENVKKEISLLKLRQEECKIYSNRALLRFELIRLKVSSYAADHGYSMSQFLMLSIYYSVADSENYTVDIKYQKLKKLTQIIESHPKFKQLLQVIDKSIIRNLQKVQHMDRMEQLKTCSEKELADKTRTVIMKYNLFQQVLS